MSLTGDRRRFGSGSSELKISAARRRKSARRFNAADLESKLADVIGRAGYLNAAADSSLTGSILRRREGWRGRPSWTKVRNST